ncbi:Helix-turn-helix XRE-family like protein [Candidatus Hepatincolaceae symbiont of Richtersius coronifer]
MSTNSISSRSSKDVDLYAGEQLKFRRLELGLSQKYLAENVGITFQQIQKYEKGTNRIGVSRLYEFCKILKVKPSYFFQNMDYGTKEQSFTYKVAENKEDADEIIFLIHGYKKIKSPSKRKLIIDLMKSLSESNTINEKSS